MNAQLERLAFVERRDGRDAAVAFARQTLRLYRATVVQRKTHTMYRRRLIEAYLVLKRWLFVVEFEKRLAESQRDLSPEAARVLYSNLWELYE